ncbi:MAG TPA: hypothetical protein VFK04_10055 [Gemmatimonadaceae bacterium]|nr:hypothetical protein [Gemmatimonadaceae bacterium]
MSAHSRVARTRAVFTLTALLAALVRGAAVATLVFVLAGALDWAVGLERAARLVVVPMALSLGALVVIFSLWRARRTLNLGAVALWIEERRPVLRYSLVTALEPGAAGAALPDLEQEVHGVGWGTPVLRTASWAVGGPTLLLLVALAVRAALPPGVVSRIETPRAGDSLEHPRRAAVAGANRLTPLVATVTPPAYTRREAVTLEEPSSIAALASSGVRLEGRGSSAGVTAVLGDEALEVMGTTERWSVIFAMPPRPAAVRLGDGGASRVIVLEPQPDSAPVVTLASPARDTVFREARGGVPLEARAADDIGLTALWLEYIVSSGEGESFTFRSGILARRAARGARTASLRSVMRLDSLVLRPGDLIHLRAVAVDGNTATGPDTGVSETRVLRVARAGEYDSLAVEGAPPPDPDASALSQRMLIQLAEELQAKRKRLARKVVVEESRRIGADQARLRKRVGDVIFSRLGEAESGEESGATMPRPSMKPEELLKAAEAATSGEGAHALDFEGDETPVVAVNRPLLEAYNAMWAAGRELEVGEPGAALPPMRAALAAIMRAREAERIYLRGRPAEVVVDLAKVRLAGDIDSASAGMRAPRARLSSSAASRAARLDAALLMLRVDPAAAVDSLALLRVDALLETPRLAAQLAEAVDSLRAGKDATTPLARARREAAGAPVVRAHASEWGGAW